MPPGGFVLVGLLGLVLAVLAIVHYTRRRSTGLLVLELVCIVSYFVVIVHFFGLPGTIPFFPKGTNSSQQQDPVRFWLAVGMLFVFIVLGMLAEGMYSWLDKTAAQRRRGFDVASMIKPLFVAPLLLIPTVAAFQNANIDLQSLGFPWLMILLTAFEKGLLWRHFMARRAPPLAAAQHARMESSHA